MRGWKSCLAAAAALLCWTAAAEPLKQVPAPPAATVPAPLPPADQARIAGFVDGLMAQAMADHGVAGATVAIVLNGAPLVLKGYGTARLEPKPRAADADTLFQVASISKTPVYIAAMQQVEAGKLALDADVNTYLPDALKIPAEGFAEPVRVRDLLAHTAGFEDLAMGHLFVGKPEKLQPMAAYLGKHRPRRVRPPGQLPSYSNYGLALLGYLVERVSSVPFDDYIEARVLRPLGMASATYRDPLDPALAKARGLPAAMSPAQVANSTQQLKGGPGNWSVAQLELTGQIAPAGGMKASARDMAAYLAALMDPQKMEAAGVLKAETFRRMIAAPSISGGPAPAAGLVRHGFIPYALPGGYSGFGHGGAMAYSASDLVVVPELGLGVFISTNTRGGFAFAYQTAARVAQAIAPRPDPAPVRTAETIAAAKALAGDWIMTRRAFHSSERVLLTPNALTTVKATDTGDLLIGSPIGPASRYEPLGDGVWRPVKPGFPVITAPGPDGRTVIYASSGTQARERAGPFQTALTLLGLPVLALFTALAALYSWAGKWRENRPQMRLEQAASLSLDLATLFWALGLGAMFATLLSAAGDDGAGLLFTYPGPFAAVGWLVAAAAALTLISWLASPAIFLRGHWGWWRRLKHAGALLVFTAAIAACWNLGIVGFWTS